MLFRKKETNPDNFWREYEEKTGEKVLARSLGQYIYGWEEFDSRGLKDIWGLVIATSGGFRFHHFPQHTWLTMFNRTTEAPKEKTIFIPKERIISAKLEKEKQWWKKIFGSTAPRLFINYRDGEEEKQLLCLADLQHGNLVENLTPQ
ncbi:MAG: hypothetical protein LBH42_03615 [Treponema sp.]|jgi:hypothetical protein|nr:hypothetical protein [Treponema sp.]